MKTVGKTAEGQEVVGGLFEAHDTLGMPLSLSLMFILNVKKVPDIYGFVKDALLHGWNSKTIKARVREAIIDVQGLEQWLKTEPLVDKTLNVFSDR